MKRRPEDKSQADRFAEAARAIGGDEDEAAFRERLAVIARQKPTSGSRRGDAFQLGLDAYAAGKDVSDNPYRDTDRKSGDWRAGWYAAEARAKS